MLIGGRVTWRTHARSWEAMDLGHYNHRRVLEKFTDDVMVTQSVSLYESILRRNRNIAASDPEIEPSTIA